MLAFGRYSAAGSIGPSFAENTGRRRLDRKRPLSGVKRHHFRPTKCALLTQSGHRGS
jgi:hypothetical protein